MSSQAPRLTGGELRDQLGRRPERSREVPFEGAIFDVVRDHVDLGGEAGEVTREYLRHPGAVVVLALRESADGADVLVIQQYRHALGVTEWELPAGLLDVPGEEPQLAAARELAEETDLRARTWHTLSGYSSSPGIIDETVRIFLARDLSEVPAGERHQREGEELGMPTRWVRLHDAVDAVLAGQVSNTGLVVGVLAAQASRARDWSTLRPADAPWPIHPARRAEA